MTGFIHPRRLFGISEPSTVCPPLGSSLVTSWNFRSTPSFFWVSSLCPSMWVLKSTKMRRWQRDSSDLEEWTGLIFESNTQLELLVFHWPVLSTPESKTTPHSCLIKLLCFSTFSLHKAFWKKKTICGVLVVLMGGDSDVYVGYILKSQNWDS